MSNMAFCGLICRRKPESMLPVPLKSVAIHADVRGWTVGVVAELTYQNDLKEPIECQYVFPLSDKSAVYRLEADMGGKKLVAECRPRQEAEETYKDAVESGHSAALLENQEGSADVFRVMLGNLPANSEAKITIGFVQPADRDADGAISFTLPSVLNPRYVPGDMLSNPEKMKENFHFKVPYVAVSEVAYSMTFDAKVSLGINSKISFIKSANEGKDTIKVTFQDAENNRASVSLDGKFTQDHDFGLNIMPAEPFKPMVFIEPGQKVGDKRSWLTMDVACAWFEPAPSAKQMGIGQVGDEYWFVIDRSGSMGGSKIQDARTALVLFVKSLPPSCKFNIVGFGSSFSTLFPEGSVNYTEETVETALNYANSLNADMGGTEILRPLEFIYNQPKTSATGARQFIVLLTDGEVGNTDQVIQLAARNGAYSRVFSVGIGEGASTALVNGLARVSGGVSEFVRNSSDKLQAKVIGLLKAATNPGADNLQLEWNVSGGVFASKMPEHLPTATYQGRPIMQYALLERSFGNNLDGHAGLKALINGLPVEFKLDFSINSSVFTEQDDAMPLHRLAAKARLQEMADDWKTAQESKPEMVAISVATGVLCNETALVAVDRDSKQPLKDEKSRPLFIDVHRPTVYRKARGAGPSGGLRMKKMSAPRAMASNGAAPPGPPMACFAAAPSPAPEPQAMRSLSSNLVSRAKLLDGGLAEEYKAEVAEVISDEMELLVRRQKLDGRWELTADLAKVSKVKDEATLREKLTSLTLVTDDIQANATLTGLAVLRHRFATRRDEWELIEAKALSYLQQKGLEAGKIDEAVKAIASALKF